MAACLAALRGFQIFIVAVVALATTAQAQWTTAPVAAPGVQYRTFQSAAAGTSVSFHIYTPPAYALQPLRRFPVLHWLYGAGSTMTGIAPMTSWFLNAMALGLLPPMIIVYPNGMPYGMYCDAADGSHPIETVIVSELIPHVDANFRTIAAQRGRILEGFSMGGYGTGRLGIRHSGLFCGISMLGAAPLQLDFPTAPPSAPIPPDRRNIIFEDVWNSDPALVLAANPWTLAAVHAQALAANSVLFRIAIGGDDAGLAPNTDFHNRLTGLGITHTFNIYPGIGHVTIPLLSAIGPSNWSFYRDALAPRCNAADIPVVFQQPQPQSVPAGQTLSLTLIPVNRYANVSVQWRRNGVPVINGPGGASPGGGTVSGAFGPIASPTNGRPATLIITNARPSDTGTYTAIFFNTCGSVTSNPAVINVRTLPCGLADVANDSLDVVYNPSGTIGPEDLDAFIARFIIGNAAIADIASDSLDVM